MFEIAHRHESPPTGYTLTPGEGTKPTGHSMDPGRTSGKRSWSATAKSFPHHANSSVLNSSLAMPRQVGLLGDCMPAHTVASSPSPDPNHQSLSLPPLVLHQARASERRRGEPFIKHDVSTLNTASHLRRCFNLPWPRQTALAVVVVPPRSRRCRVVDAACVMATFRTASHVAYHSAQRIMGTSALYLWLTQHIMQQRAANLCGTPAHQLQAKHTRCYADMMLLKRRALAVASANHVAAPTEVAVNLSRLEIIIQSTLHTRQ